MHKQIELHIYKYHADKINNMQLKDMCAIYKHSIENMSN